MLQKATKFTPDTRNDLNQVLMIAYKTVNPVEPSEKKQSRFMLFIRLRPGIPTYFKDGQRTHYYRGDTYTNQEPQMLINLLKLLNNHYMKYDRIELYDNAREGEERIILKITDDTFIKNDLHLYGLLIKNYLLPQWLKQ